MVSELVKTGVYLKEKTSCFARHAKKGSLKLKTSLWRKVDYNKKSKWCVQSDFSKINKKTNNVDLRRFEEGKNNGCTIRD